MSMQSPEKLESPARARSLLNRLQGFQERDQQELHNVQLQLKTKGDYIQLSGKVSSALDTLSQSLFNELLSVIEQKLSIALQEVLEQPIQLKAVVEWRRNQAAVDFWIENDGNREDILKGQGGSVANVVSVGLRMFALMSLPESEHRRFLVLDEQDCWLKPEIVPRFIKIVHDAGNALGFQVLMISHHDISKFENLADRIYELIPKPNNAVKVALISSNDIDSENSEEGFGR